MTNYVKFWNEDEEAIVFDYTDVYESFGDITEADVSGWFKGKRFDEKFNVGTLEIGNFFLDPNFGYETKGGASITIASRIRGASFTCPETGTAESITVCLNGWGSGEKVKCALYKKSDDSLVGVTQERSDGGEDWQTFNFDEPKPELTAIDYIICVYSDSGAKEIWYNAVSIYRYYKSVAYNSYPNPFDGTKGDATLKLSIYCTYSTEEEEAFVGWRCNHKVIIGAG